MTDEEFQAAAAALGVRLDKEAIGRFGRYHDLLAEANQRTNLTRITERRDVYVKHFLDSLAGASFLRESDGRLVDVGSGAGFPGLALKIARPSLDVTLVESAGKKAEFLRHVVRELGLEGVNVLAMRVENVCWDAGDREQYDVAVVRAVKRIAVVSEYALPLVRLDGRVIAYAGTDPSEEVEEADVALLGGVVESVRRVEIPELDAERHLVVLRKLVHTPSNYPRRVGVPEKRPLLRSSVARRSGGDGVPEPVE